MPSNLTLISSNQIELAELSLERAKAAPRARAGNRDWSLPVDPFILLVHAIRELTLTEVPLFSSIPSLRTLTELTLLDDTVQLRIDALLSSSEENHSLESASSGISFGQHALRLPQRPSPVGNTLQRLPIEGRHAEDNRPLTPNIALQKGATLLVGLEIDSGLTNILSGVSTAHLPSLSSGTSIEYQNFPRSIRLLGLGESFSYNGHIGSAPPFGD